MKLYSNLMIVLILFSLSLQSGMRHVPEFKIDTTLQPGMEIYNTGRGWLFMGESKSKFPVKIASLAGSGDILWERSFAFPASDFLPHEGGAYMLDVNGNFYALGRTGTVEHNLTAVVPHGRNIMAKSHAGAIYASGGDDTITCFYPDGNIQWMVQAGDTPTNIFVWDEFINVMDRSGTLTRYNPESDVEWELRLEGFAISNPIPTPDKSLVYGTRDSMGQSGMVYEISESGEIIWDLKLGHSVNTVIAAGDGYLAIGPLFVTSINAEGERMWGQSFELSRKLFPLGLNDDGRLVLGLYNAERDGDSVKITLLSWGGKIHEVTKIPVKKNKLVNVSRHENLIMIADKDETLVYRLLTMKEFLEMMNE